MNAPNSKIEMLLMTECELASLAIRMRKITDEEFVSIFKYEYEIPSMKVSIPDEASLKRASKNSFWYKYAEFKFNLYNSLVPLT